MPPSNAVQMFLFVPAPRVTILWLNDDILSEILSLLSMKDSLNLSETCRRLYPVSKHNALKEVTMSKAEQLPQFCSRYLISQTPRHIWVLRTLDLSTAAAPFPASSARLLEDLLREAENCRVLKLANMENLVISSFGLGHALAALRRLEEVKLHLVGPWALMALASLRSRPNKVFLDSFVDIGYDRLFEALSYPAFSSLQTLGLNNPPKRMEVKNAHLYQLPSVRSLWLSHSRVPQYDLVHVLPNVRALHLKGVVYWNKIRTFWYWHCYEMIPCWPALDFVSTSGLFGWHLHCPIHWLNADNIFDGHLHCGDIDESLILEELRDGLPVVFSFRVTDRRHLIFWTWVLQRTMPRLRCLEFELVVCSYWWYDVASYLEEVASILAESNIIYIHIRFRPISLYTPPVWWELPQTFSPGLTDISCTYKDIPSLRYLSIDRAACDAQDSDLCNKRNFLREEPQWWRMFTVQSGDKVVSRIPTFIGEQIQERLHSPTYDCMQDFDDSEWFAEGDALANARATSLDVP